MSIPPSRAGAVSGGNSQHARGSASPSPNMWAMGPQSGGPAVAMVTVPATSGQPPIPLYMPTLVVADGHRDRTDTWLSTLSGLLRESGQRVTHIRPGPKEARASRARKALIADALADATNDHLAGLARDDVFYIVDLTGAYDHTGRSDDHESAEMGHSVVEAVKAARQPSGLRLAIVVESLSDLPDSLSGFETVVTAAAPSEQLTHRLGTPSTSKSRPTSEPPQGHLWAASGGDDGWALAPVSVRHRRAKG